MSRIVWAAAAAAVGCCAATAWAGPAGIGPVTNVTKAVYRPVDTPSPGTFGAAATGRNFNLANVFKRFSFSPSPTLGVSNLPKPGSVPGANYASPIQPRMPVLPSAATTPTDPNQGRILGAGIR